MNIELHQITIEGAESVIILLNDIDTFNLPPSRITDHLKRVKQRFIENNKVLERLNEQNIAWNVVVSGKR